MRSVVLAALVFWAGAALAKEPRRSKTGVSASGRYSVKLVEEGEGKCRLEVLKESAPHWQLDACIATVHDLYFVSDDGARVWVLETIPEKGKRRPKRVKRRYPVWTYTSVARLYDRDGKVVRSKQLNDFVKKLGWQNVRQLKKHVKWLEGVAGVPGNPPRLNAEGLVEFDTVEPKTYRLAFE